MLVTLQETRVCLSYRNRQFDELPAIGHKLTVCLNRDDQTSKCRDRIWHLHECRAPLHCPEITGTCPDLCLRVGGTSVDLLGVGLGDNTDGASCQQLPDRHTGKAAVDSQTVRQDGGGDQLVLGDLRVKLLVGGLCNG